MTVNATGFGFDPHSRKGNISLNVYFDFFTLLLGQSAVWSSATKHAMPPEFARKWGTECLNNSLFSYYLSQLKNLQRRLVRKVVP